MSEWHTPLTPGPGQVPGAWVLVEGLHLCTDVERFPRCPGGLETANKPGCPSLTTYQGRKTARPEELKFGKLINLVIGVSGGGAR